MTGMVDCNSWLEDGDMRLIVCICVLFALAPETSSAEENDSVKLIVVDRSMSKDSLYFCNLHVPKDVPVELAGLVMYDRKREKVGEVMLGLRPEITEGQVGHFWLNHELVKFSVVLVHLYPPTDDRHEELRFVVGERSAWKKEGDKKVEVKIE
jgi:hypothetical protein